MELNLPETVNLYDEMQKQSKLHPNKVIIEDLKGTLTYKDFLVNVNILSQKLKVTTQNEDRVGIYLPNVIGQVVTIFSLFKNEQDPCLLNFSMGIKSLLECLETASLQTVITSREFIEAGNLYSVIEEMEKKVRIIYLEDLKNAIAAKHKIIGFIESKIPNIRKRKQKEVILFTSGTESKPKGVVLTHRNIYANIKQALAHIDINETDSIFNPLPLFHSFGLTVGAVLPLIGNVHSFLYPSPLHYKEIPKWIHRKKSTVFVATNTFFDNYSKFATKEQLQTLKIVVSGAEKLRNDVRENWEKEFGISILQGYGTTETSPIVSLNTPKNHKIGSVGKPIPLMEYKIEKVEGIEEGGSLLLKGPNIMKGYLIHGKGYVPCGEFFDTGDIVRTDEEGYLYILSRRKRFAKLAGEMIPLYLVEELAFECYGESKFYAVAIPDNHKGEKIVLFTSLQNISGKSLKSYIKRKKLSSLYIPSSIEYIEKLPILPTGKPNYLELENIALNIKRKNLF